MIEAPFPSTAALAQMFGVPPERVLVLSATPPSADDPAGRMIVVAFRDGAVCIYALNVLIGTDRWRVDPEDGISLDAGEMETLRAAVSLSNNGWRLSLDAAYAERDEARAEAARFRELLSKTLAVGGIVTDRRWQDVLAEIEDTLGDVNTATRAPSRRPR